MKTLIIVIAITITVFVLYVFSDVNKSINNYYFQRKDVHQYGGIVYFEKAEKLIYPDFAIAYQGIKKSSFEVPNTNKVIRTISIDIFSVCTPIDQSTQTDTNCTEVKWSAGIGELAPTRFTVKGQKYTIIKVMNDGVLEGSSKSGAGWVVAEVVSVSDENVVVDESYVLGTWQGLNDVGSGKYIFQKVNGKNVLSGHYSFAAQSSRTPLTDCTWSLGRDQVGRDGFAFTMYCEKISHYQSFDTITKNIAGDKLYLSNKTDKKFGEDLTLTRVVDHQSKIIQKY